REFLLTSGLVAAGLTAGCVQEVGPDAALTSAAATPRADDLVRLNLAENAWGCSQKAYEAMIDHANGANRYAGAEKTALIAHIADANGVATDQIVLGNGSKPILAAAGAVFARGGGQLVTSDLTYAILNNSAEAFGAELVRVPLTETHDWDFAGMTAALGDETIATYVCNPNGPTGRLCDPTELRAFVIEAAKYGPVFVDEAYLDMSPDYPANSMVGLVAEGHNVIVSRTLSKMHGLAGQRLGYAMGPVDLVDSIHRLLTNHINLAGLVAGLASLEDIAYQEEMRERFKQGRARLVGLMDALGLDYVPEPMHNGVLFDVGGPVPDFHEKMLSENILVRTGGYNDERATWTSICVVTESEMDKVEAAMTKVFKA
ncbi:MAG: histidinol-phosphate transaminase, partial [Pseudomonadota bacterium]